MGDRLADIMLLLLIAYNLTVFPLAVKGLVLQSPVLLGFSIVLSSIYFLVTVVVYFLKSYGVIR